MKLTPVQQAQSELLYGYIEKFHHWPQSLSEMIRDWTFGFYGKNRQKDVERCLNHLAEQGRIKFVPMSMGVVNMRNEIGFVLGEQAKDDSE